MGLAFLTYMLLPIQTTFCLHFGKLVWNKKFLHPFFKLTRLDGSRNDLFNVLFPFLKDRSCPFKSNLVNCRSLKEIEIKVIRYIGLN